MKKFYILFMISLYAFLAYIPAYAEIPPGYYYNATGLKNKELKTALHHIISKGTRLSYGSGEGKTWEGFYATDRLEDGSVLDRYSSIKRYFNNFAGVDGMHIEHSFPKSWWKGYENNAYKDLFHLYPADGTTNITKGNLPLGETVTHPSFDNGMSKIGTNTFGNMYTGSCFEPTDEYKGDFARSYLYIVTAYEDFADWWNSPMLENNTYPVWNQWSTDLLLKWHRNDPVSELERNRQEQVFDIQGNRNPFIDYPELAEYIWGDKLNDAYLFPVETQPFLNLPTQWASLNMGVLMLSDMKSQSLNISGKNLNSELSLKFSTNSASFILSHTLITPNEANSGTEISITFHAIEPGYIYDTLVISSPDLPKDRRIPLSALVAKDFMLTGGSEIMATQMTFNWMTVPDIDYYKIDVYQGDLNAGDLIISEYIEGSSNNKAIELYNGTGHTVDLSEYSLRKQSNGSGNFNFEYKLSGYLINNTTYVLSHPSATDNLKAKADVIILPDGGPLNFNGNDAIGLYRNGIMIDLIGEKDNPGMWGENCTLIRDKNITHPRATYNAADWKSNPVDYIGQVGLHAMEFAETSSYICQGQNTGTAISYTCEGLTPNQSYTYSVTAVLKDASELASNSTMQAKTAELQIPEVLAATEIKPDAFTANWEAIPEASHYLIDLFQLSGVGDIYESENFDTYEKGQKLPNNWTGNPSDIYDKDASSGKKPNALRLNGMEWVQSPVYPSYITKLDFMYRFPSGGDSSYFTVEGFDGNEWINIDTIRYVNTTKHFPVYSLEPKFNTIKIAYANKAASSFLALDDIGITYGAFDTTFVVKARPVYENTYTFENLSEETDYWYSVCAKANNYQTKTSESMNVRTSSILSASTEKENSIRLIVSDTEITLQGIQNRSNISIYDTYGILLSETYSDKESISIPFNKKGIYILQVSSGNQRRIFKILR